MKDVPWLLTLLAGCLFGVVSFTAYHAGKYAAQEESREAYFVELDKFNKAIKAQEEKQNANRAAIKELMEFGPLNIAVPVKKKEDVKTGTAVSFCSCGSWCGCCGCCFYPGRTK